MIYKFSAKTDTGRIRHNNEDSLAIDEQTHLAVLADGMGGYNAGEVASSMATAYIHTELGRWLGQDGATADPDAVRRAMESCVDAANLAIYNAAQANPQYAGMGTTLVMAVFREEEVLVGHVGDSRCYRWREGSLVQLTRDHSLLQERIDAGLVTPEQAQHSNIKNLVTRALGVESAAPMEVHAHPLEAGDVYLLCSDGLSDMVRDDVIAQILGNATPLDRQVEALVDAANDHGGRDNISVLLVDVAQPGEKKGLIARLLGQ